MNPGYLFSLSDAQRARYRNQPDLAKGRQINELEEYEHPPFIENAALRLWYNDQPDHYMTHWHNATEMITVLECGYTVTVQNLSHSAWCVALDSGESKGRRLPFYFSV